MSKAARASEAARVSRLASALVERGVDRLLVSDLVNIRYLTGFNGSSALAVIGAEESRRHLFLTDFRYATQSAEEVSASFQIEIAQGEMLASLAKVLAGETGKLGFEDSSLTVEQHAKLAAALPGGWQLLACGGLVEDLREVKDDQEIARIKAATQLADEALRGTLEAGLVGRSEREVAIELELRMRRLGASGPSFPSIVAFGAHGALPHAEPRAAKIASGCLVTIDFGAMLDGYCSDCTRTYATGRISEQAKEVYELVLRAQQAALAAVRPGPSGRDVDAVGREIIEAAGMGERFGHGLGHGVGMEVHERPRLSRTAGEQPLAAGQVVTIEPGVYLEGALGVRIEDLVVVTDAGHEVLTELPKQLTTIE
jgi:Xaa-Pro aminopeptidase